jgi:hypothetical protein
VVHGAREVGSGGAHHAAGERLKVSMINLLFSPSSCEFHYSDSGCAS